MNKWCVFIIMKLTTLNFGLMIEVRGISFSFSDQGMSAADLTRSRHAQSQMW